MTTFECDYLLERLDTLSNPSLICDIKRGLKEFEEGKTVKLSEIRKIELKNKFNARRQARMVAKIEKITGCREGSKCSIPRNT